MLSLKSRVLALAATGALATVLALPAFAQAIWADFRPVPPEGGIVSVDAISNSTATGETVAVSYQSDGPTVSGPTSVVVAPYQNVTSFDVEVGAGTPGDTVRVGVTGPTTNTVCWIEVW